MIPLRKLKRLPISPDLVIIGSMKTQVQTVTEFDLKVDLHQKKVEVADIRNVLSAYRRELAMRTKELKEAIANNRQALKISQNEIKEIKRQLKLQRQEKSKGRQALAEARRQMKIMKLKDKLRELENQ